MPSYRGIVLDAIHPSIKAALDVEQNGFSREDRESYNHITTRTPWMRSVPFVIPEDPDDETVPNWQDWVLYSMQGIRDEIGGINFGRYGTTSNNPGDELYRSNLRNTPVPAITRITVSNKGDLGTIRRATLGIKCYHEADLANLEMMYMVPGTSILLEWGWFSNVKRKSPIPLYKLQSGAGSLIDAENPRNAIQEEILKRIFDSEDIMREYDVDTTDNRAGLYDGLIGSVTKFNWTNAADGTFDLSIDIMAPNNLSLGVPTSTYQLGANIVNPETGKSSPVNDVEGIYYKIFTKAAEITKAQSKDLITEELIDTLEEIKATAEANQAAQDELAASPYADLAFESDTFQPYVDYQENMNLKNAALVVDINNQAADELKEAIDVAQQEEIAIANSIIYNVNTKDYLTWTQTNFVMSNNGNSPILTVDTPGIGILVERELERSFLNSDINELGIAVYGETYVSWRFIEDYIINELFMPRISSNELEVYFSSMTPIPKAPTADDDDPVEWESVKIINSKWLRSIDPRVCILPGQELTISSDQNNVEPLPASNALKDVENLFSVDNEMFEGYIRNLLININVVRGAAEEAKTVSDFALDILTQVSEACGKPWSFKVVTNTELGIVSVIDENHGGNLLNYTTVKESNPTPYNFSGIGDTNIARDLKIQTKLPNEIQALAYYAMSGASSNTSADINMFKLYGARVRDRLKTGLVKQNVEEQEEQNNDARDNIWNSFRDALNFTRVELTRGKDKSKEYRESLKTAENFVKSFICNSSEDTKLYSPPIPIDISLTLNGVSGIYMGNSIMVDTVSKGGILPERYKDIVALQVTSVDQEIAADSWTTSISTLMRPISKIVKSRIPEDVVEEQIAVETITESPGEPEKEPIIEEYREFDEYLTFTDTPYIKGTPQKQQTFYAMRGSQSKGIFETEGDGIEYISKKMFESFLALARAAKDAGHVISINDAYRTQAKQQYLYDGYVNGTPGFNLAARPGYSKHQSGDAIDIDVGRGDIYRWLIQNAWRYGYMRTVAKEEWHWVYAPGIDVYSRVPKGHRTWYGVEMLS
tara:strand:- start:9696 stop:12857 length:3162 start_codon:yes stop_codon:yes gene_type:complete